VTAKANRNGAGAGPVVLVLLVAAALYANTLRGGFVLDDSSIIRQNPLIQSLRRAPELFLSDYWEPTTRSGLYRPLTTLSYALNFAVAGDRPALYHGVNVLLHALNSAFVLLVCLRVSGNRGVAVAAALLFAAHAVHTEAVAGVVGRAELLSTCFFLSSLLLYLRSGEREGSSSSIAYSGSLAAYALSLLSKENGITLLGVLFCHDLVYRSHPGESLVGRARRLFASRGRRYLGYLAVALGYLVLRHLVLAEQALVPATKRLDNPLVDLSPGWRALNALQVSLRYLGLLLFPVRLSYDYSYNQIPMLDSLVDPRSLGVLGGAFALVVASAVACRRSRALCFAISFFVVTFSIVSNLLFPIGTIMGERLLYLPSVGFCLALALALRWLVDHLPLSPAAARAGFGLALGTLVALHGARTLVRNQDWASGERLYLHDLAVSPKSAKVQNNAGVVLVARGEIEEGIEHFRNTIAIHPSHGSAYGSLGDALFQLGREQEAIEAYEAAVRRPLKHAVPLNNLGFLLVDRSIDPPRGVRLLEQAVRIEPDNPHFLDSLGWAYFKTGRAREGRTLVARSLELDPSGDSGSKRREHLRVIDAELGQEASSSPERPVGRH
jgi:Tfp pilus assembly protein PilF